MDLTLCHSVLLISEIQNNSLCSCQGVNVWCWESVLTLVSRGVKSILPALNHSSRKMTIVAQWNVCKCTHKSPLSTLHAHKICISCCKTDTKMLLFAPWSWEGADFRLAFYSAGFEAPTCFECGSRTLWFDSTSLAPIVSWHLSAVNSLTKS